MIQVHTDGLQTVIPLLIRGVTSILHIFSILSAPSMIEYFKTLLNCLNWLSRWYRFIQTGCKQLSPCLSGVSHLYRTHFQSYQCHLWLKSLKLWWIAIIDLIDNTGSYRQAANSYSPAYLFCHINTAHIFNFISAIYDWILKTLINCLNWLNRWYRFLQAGCKQLSSCLSGVSHQYYTLHVFSILSAPSMIDFF